MDVGPYTLVSNFPNVLLVQYGDSDSLLDDVSTRSKTIFVFFFENCRLLFRLD